MHFLQEFIVTQLVTKFFLFIKRVYVYVCCLSPNRIKNQLNPVNIPKSSFCKTFFFASTCLYPFLHLVLRVTDRMLYPYLMRRACYVSYSFTLLRFHHTNTLMLREKYTYRLWRYPLCNFFLRIISAVVVPIF